MIAVAVRSKTGRAELMKFFTENPTSFMEVFGETVPDVDLEFLLTDDESVASGISEDKVIFLGYHPAYRYITHMAMLHGFSLLRQIKYTKAISGVDVAKLFQAAMKAITINSQDMEMPDLVFPDEGGEVQDSAMEGLNEDLRIAAREDERRTFLSPPVIPPSPPPIPTPTAPPPVVEEIPAPPPARPDPQPAARAPFGSGRSRIRLGDRSAAYSKVVLVLGATAQCGATRFSYMLANKLAGNKKTLLMDLDILKPDLSKLIGGVFLFSSEASSVRDLLGMSEKEACENIGYMATPLTYPEGYQLDFLGAPVNLAFKERRAMSTAEYAGHLLALTETYEYIVVDAGRFTGALEYQFHLIDAGNVVLGVVNGTRRETVREAIETLRQFTFDFGCVVNRLEKNVSPDQLERQLQRRVWGSIPHMNLLEKRIQDGSGVTGFGGPVMENMDSIVQFGIM